MKRMLSLLLGAALMLSLAACGGTPDEAEDTPTPAASGPAEPTSAPEPTPEPTPEPVAEKGKTLVVYFSATGNTGRVAQTIAGTLEADVFEIIPAQPYTDADLNWRDANSRVCREHDDPSLQGVELEAVTPESWADYDTVFIGYPIWWQNASWVVGSFVSANDFEGKTVYTFCTSSSSNLGESHGNLAALANGGDWVEGVRFRSSVNDADVTAWVKGLDLPDAVSKE